VELAGQRCETLFDESLQQTMFILTSKYLFKNTLLALLRLDPLLHLDIFCGIERCSQPLFFPFYPRPIPTCRQTTHSKPTSLKGFPPKGKLIPFDQTDVTKEHGRIFSS
jgi:hypothetical protein